MIDAEQIIASGRLLPVVVLGDRVGGTWLAPPDLIAAADWSEITHRTQRAMTTLLGSSPSG